LGSALMDAQMHIAGKKVDFLSGGKIAALEVKTELKLQIHEYQVALDKGEKPDVLAKKADTILQLGDLPALEAVSDSNAKVFESILIRAGKTGVYAAKDPVSMNLWIEAVSSYKSLVKNGESEAGAAKKALDYVKSIKFDAKTGTFSSDLNPAITPRIISSRETRSMGFPARPRANLNSSN